MFEDHRAVESGVSKIKKFNGMHIREYLQQIEIKHISLYEHLDGIDATTVDPIYCALVLYRQKQFQCFRF